MSYLRELSFSFDNFFDFDIFIGRGEGIIKLSKIKIEIWLKLS